VPPLPIEQLPPVIVGELQDRVGRLPVRAVRNRLDWYAVCNNETKVVWRLADEHQVSDDERYSLLSLHLDACQAAVPEDARERDIPALERLEDSTLRLCHRRSYWLIRRLHPEGWPSWIGNRIVDVKAAQLRFTRKQ